MCQVLLSGALSANNMKISALVESAFQQRGDRHTIRKHDTVLVGDNCCELKEEKADEEPRMTGKVAVLFRVFCRGFDEEVRLEKRCGGEKGRTLNKDLWEELSRKRKQLEEIFRSRSRSGMFEEQQGGCGWSGVSKGESK